MSLSLIFALLIPASAAQAVTAETEGTVMTQNAFKNYFFGENSSALQPASASSTPELTLNNISYNHATRALTVTGSVTDTQGNAKTMSLSGTMYNSYQTLDDINSTVAVLTDEDENFDVLLFNVFNSTETSTIQFDSSLAGVPHLKVYLMDQSTGNMYFFELDIPQQFADISIPVSEDNICPDMLYDMLWFANVIEADVEQISNDQPQIVPMANHSGQKALDQLHMSWDGIAGQYDYYTTPIIIYDVNDITGGSTVEWSFAFATSNGYAIAQGTRYDLTAIQIKQVQLGATAGQYTMFTGNAGTSCKLCNGSTTAQTIVYEAIGAFGEIADGFNITPASVGATIIQALIDLTTKDQDVIGETYYYANDEVRALSIGMASRTQWIQHDYDNGSGEYIEMTVDARKIPAYANQVGAKDAYAYAEYVAEYGATTYTADPETVSIDYVLLV